MEDSGTKRRRRLIAVLLGFSLFGALFAATYYQPEASAGEERHDMKPMYRLGPGEMQPEFIEPGEEGEHIHVNITVLKGGPLDVYKMDVENMAFRALNGSSYSFQLNEDVEYDKDISRRNITTYYNFSLTLDGETRTALLLASSLDPATLEPGEDNVTEVAIDTWHPETQTESLITAYVMAAPSVLLVGYVVYRRFRSPHL